ncbi:MAG TPA: serine/threonine-protein kinase [Pirellulales bacterium]
MSLSLERFWKLTAESQLLSDADRTTLGARFAQQQGPSASAELAARWLIDEKRISPYQAKVLLAGRPGPFVYGDYRIYDRIESGRLAGIFRALHAETRHPVCLYFLSGAAAQDPEILHRLAQQAAAAHRASVGHPHLSRCYHLADEKTYKFIVLQDLQGKRLERRLATGGALPPAEACRVARQAALGLARLHAMGLAHGDVRPANIWLDSEGVCKLLLFPLSRDPLSDAPPGQLVAKTEGRRPPPQADYIAPELIDGGEADARSDIYSLGCTLYHALANQAPFAGGDLNQKLQRHRTETPLPLDEVNPAISPALAKLVKYMMAKDPDLRYQQANSVVEGLLPHLAPGEAETQPRPPSRRSQAYEAWLAKHLAATPHATPTPTPAKAPAQPGAVELAAAAPAAPMSVAPAPAAPVQAVAAQAMPAPALAPTVAFAPGALPTRALPMGALAPGQAVAMAAVAQPVSPMAQAVAPAVAQAVAMPVQPGYPSAMPAVAATPLAAPAYATAVPLGMPTAAAAMPAASLHGGPMPSAMPGQSHELAAVTMEAGEPAGVRARRVARRNRRMALGVGLAMLVTLGVTLGAIYKLGGKEILDELESTPSATHKADASAVTLANAPPVEGTIPKQPTVPLEPIWTPDGKMWSSPTHGKPVDVAFLAPGPEAVIVLRPADLLKHPQGEKLLDPKVLGPLADWVRTTLPAISGTSLENIVQVVVGVLESGGNTRLALVVHVKDPVAEPALLKAWGNPAAEKLEDKTYFKKENVAYYVPKSRKGQVIVVAPPEEMKDVVASDGQAVLLPLDVERLLHHSDGDRMLTAVIGPGLLSTPGKGLFTGAAARLKEPIDWFLTGADPASPMPTAEPRAVMFSCHLKSELFVELRVENDQAGPQSPDPAKAMRDRLKLVTKKVDLGVHSLEWTPYSQNVLVDLPDMVRMAQQFTRIGTADKEIVLRTYLPAAAASSLALGAYLCLLENPRGVGTSLAAAGSVDQKPQTAADKLKKITSVSFPNNPLDKTIDVIADDIGVHIEINGDDFKKEGITKNQAITNLNEQNKPASDILRVIMLKARPDDKIVYVFQKMPDGTEGIMLTTRTAVAERGLKLPPELAQQLSTKKKK